MDHPTAVTSARNSSQSFIVVSIMCEVEVKKMELVLGPPCDQRASETRGVTVPGGAQFEANYRPHFFSNAQLHLVLTTGPLLQCSKSPDKIARSTKLHLRESHSNAGLDTVSPHRCTKT